MNQAFRREKKKFNLIIEAHTVLSDSRRRQRYDMGEDEDGMSEAGIGPGGMNFAGLLAQSHGGGRASFVASMHSGSEGADVLRAFCFGCGNWRGDT
jgi:DnaJ family protein C protein 7